MANKQAQERWRKDLEVLADRKIVKKVRPYKSINDPQMFAPIIKFNYSE